MENVIDIDKISEYFSALRYGEIFYSAVGELEKALIEKALEKTNGNQIAAAKLLGVNRNTLRTKIRILSININRFKL